MKAMIARTWLAAAVASAIAGAAQAQCYIELHGSAAQFGYSRAGPYESRSECNAMRARLGLDTECTCGASGPTPEEIEWMRQQEEAARIREEARQAEQRRLDAERERLRQVWFHNSQGNDMMHARLFDEAIRAYETALSYGQDPAVHRNLANARFRRAFAQGKAFFDGGQWDLAIDAYREALVHRPGDSAAESNIKVAQTRKRSEEVQAELRAKRETAFASMRSAIEDHAASAQAERAARPRASEAPAKLFFGDPDSPTDVALNAKIERMDAQIERDVQAIRNLGLAKLDDDYEDWVSLDEKARRDAEEQFIEILHDVAFDLVKDGVSGGLKSFDQAQGVALIRALEKCGCALNNPAFIERIKLMSRRGNAAHLAEDAKILIKEFEGLWKAHDADAKGKQMLEGAADVLELAVDDKRLKLVLYTAKMGAAAAYRTAVKSVARAEVERLTKMTERQMKALKFLQKTLIKHVKERRELKRLLTEPLK